MRYMIKCLVIGLVGCGKGSGSGNGPLTETGTGTNAHADSALIDTLPISFSDVASLPACDESGKDRMAFAKKEAMFQSCDGTAWHPIDLSADPAICKAPPDETSVTKISKRISRETVIRILGNPDRVDTSPIVAWYFNGKVCAPSQANDCSIFFDEKGKVSSVSGINTDLIDLTSF